MSRAHHEELLPKQRTPTRGFCPWQPTDHAMGGGRIGHHPIPIPTSIGPTIIRAYPEGRCTEHVYVYSPTSRARNTTLQGHRCGIGAGNQDTSHQWQTPLLLELTTQFCVQLKLGRPSLPPNYVTWKDGLHVGVEIMFLHQQTPPPVPIVDTEGYKRVASD